MGGFALTMEWRGIHGELAATVEGISDCRGIRLYKLYELQRRKGLTANEYLTNALLSGIEYRDSDGTRYAVFSTSNGDIKTSEV